MAFSGGEQHEGYNKTTMTASPSTQAQRPRHVWWSQPGWGELDRK
jgi:hypothetical protein